MSSPIKMSAIKLKMQLQYSVFSSVRPGQAAATSNNDDCFTKNKKKTNEKENYPRAQYTVFIFIKYSNGVFVFITIFHTGFAGSVRRLLVGASKNWGTDAVRAHTSRQRQIPSAENAFVTKQQLQYTNFETLFFFIYVICDCEHCLMLSTPGRQSAFNFIQQQSVYIQWSRAKQQSTEVGETRRRRRSSKWWLNCNGNMAGTELILLARSQVDWHSKDANAK